MVPFAIALSGLGLIGVALALLYFGLRGRRLDDHPICRKCRFDLSGLASPETLLDVCPECGRDVSTPKGRRVGNRAKRPVLLASSAPPLLAALALGGIVIMAQQGQWNQYKPTWMLVMESRHGDSSVAGSAFDELLHRVAQGQENRDVLNAALRRAIDERLAIEGEVDANGQAWVRILVEAANNPVGIDDELLAEISRGMVREPRIAMRSRHLANQPIRLRWIEPGFPPFGRAESAGFRFWPEEILIDGQQLEIEQGRPLVIALGRGGSGRGPLTGVEPVTLEPGQHEIIVRGRAGATYNALGSGPGTSMAFMQNDPAVTWDIELSHSFEVFAEIEDALDLVGTEDDPAAIGLTPGWTREHAWQGSGPGGPPLSWYVLDETPRDDGLADVTIHAVVNRHSAGREVGPAPALAVRMVARIDGEVIPFIDAKQGEPIRYTFDAHDGGVLSEATGPVHAQLRGVPPGLDRIEVLFEPDQLHALTMRSDAPVWEEPIGPFEIPLDRSGLPSQSETDPD